jgi:hypothetical protein
MRTRSFSLSSHRDTPALSVASVEVELRFAPENMLMLVYRVSPAETLKLPNHPAGPTDGLWQHTCFEIFARERGAPAYRELNFAPWFGWAAYAFTHRRAGMTPLDLAHPPHLVDSRIGDGSHLYPAIYEFDVVLDRRVLPDGPASLALSAVIEETDGTKSYWALRHPPGPPDFHHPDCFALDLPALGGS